MWSLRNIVIFLAGAEAFHTLVHMAFGASSILPIKILFYTLTPQFNLIAIIINALITLGLIWWASTLP
jgi:hypothetical protein